MGTIATRESLQQLDAQLAAVAREGAALRLRLGQVLEAMQRKGYCFELGLSSLGAYALERSERGARWVEVACNLARRLEVLPLLRSVVATGRVSWSMGELLARVAQPQDEVHWLELAQRCTLREMRREVSKVRAAGDEALADERRELCTLSCTLDREDAWLLEATRALLDQFGTRGADEQLEALLAEGQGALLASFPAEAVDLQELDCTDEVQQRWREQLARWRDEAEERCEPRIRAAVIGQAPVGQAPVGQAAVMREAVGQAAVGQAAVGQAAVGQAAVGQAAIGQAAVGQVAVGQAEVGQAAVGQAAVGQAAVEQAVLGAGEVTLQAAQGAGSLEGLKSRELDGAVRQLAAALAGHELRLSRLLWRFHRADGWRRLGYATETQYARERLGLSRSSVIARRSLALRLEALPHVAMALSRAEIGVEAVL